jgi:hypothetical protein
MSVPEDGTLSLYFCALYLWQFCFPEVLLSKVGGVTFKDETVAVEFFISNTNKTVRIAETLNVYMRDIQQLQH